MTNRLVAPSRAHFFLFVLILLPLCLLPLIGCAAPVIKMPKPMPDIVKEYKSVVVGGNRAGMYDSGIRVKDGDYLTFMAKGEIDFWPAKRVSSGPIGKLLYRVGEKGFYRRYYGENEIRLLENGNIYLGLADGPVDPYGEPSNPEWYRDNLGIFVVDIIVWKKYDPLLMADFWKEASHNDPKNKELKFLAERFKNLKEILLAEEKAKKEVEESKEAIVALERKEVPAIKGPDKEKQVAELSEKLQKALQALKELEELKKKLKEEEEKGRELAARLARLEEEKLKEAQNPPVVVIASPRDGITVDSETISLHGVAEDDKGITQIEILVNDQLFSRKGQRDLQVVVKDSRRIDFAERIRLREGKNEISVIAQDTEGLTSRTTISLQMARKQEKIWAVVIGIGRYKNIPSLKYAANDARELYRYLIEVNRVPKDQIWLLLDEEATLDRLRSILGTHLRRQAGKDDTVIIYLAGHGATERDASSPDGDGLEKYILPHNADPKDLYASAIPMSEMARIFQRISSDRLVFLSDTCYSGASGGRTVPVLGIRANISGGFLDRLTQGQGRVILTASDVNEVSVEKDELKHGVFTYYLLEALRGKGDLDGDGVITVDEVYRYVSLKVPQATGQDQHPVRKGEMKGQIILGVLK